MVYNSNMMPTLLLSKLTLLLLLGVPLLGNGFAPQSQYGGGRSIHPPARDTCSPRLYSTTPGSSPSPSSSSVRPDHSKKKQAQKAKDIFTDTRAQQLLGIPGTPVEEKYMIRLQLMKPLSWVPLSLIVTCGAAASGNYHWIWNPFDPSDRNVAAGLWDAGLAFGAAVLAGPFSEGFAQTINDWYDREIDAINEPYRPIPSGAITPAEVWEQLIFLFVGGLVLAVSLDVAAHHELFTVTGIALFGYFMSYIYSAPPLKLKQNGWLGDLAIGLCYISLPWWCGRSVFGSMDRPVDWML